MGYFPRRDINAKDYGEMGSNPNRKRRGKKRGAKGGRRRRTKGA